MSNTLTQPVVTTQNGPFINISFSFNGLAVSLYTIREIKVSQTNDVNTGVSYPVAAAGNVGLDFNFTNVPGQELVTVPDVPNYIFARFQSTNPLVNPPRISPALVFTYQEQGQPPSTPILVSSTNNAYVVSFQNNGLPTNGYQFGVRVSSTPDTNNVFLTSAADETSQNLFTSQVLTLPINVPNYVFSVAVPRTPALPDIYSATFLQLQFNSPVSPTEAPFLVTSTPTTITVNFDTRGQTGFPPVTYTVQYSTFADFAQFTQNTTFPVSGTVFGSGPFPINPAVLNYVRVLSSNATTQAFSPVFTYNPAASSPPSGPTLAPTLVGISTQNMITVGYSTAGITGTQPLTTQCFASLAPGGPFTIGTLETLVSPNTFEASAFGLLPDTDYYFQTIVSNGVLPNQTSAVSAPFRTAAISPNAPSIAPSIPILNVGPSSNSIQVYIESDLVDGTQPVTIYAIYDTNPNGPFVDVATIIPSPDDLVDRWVATATGLEPNTTYYFKSVANNVFGFIISQVSEGFRTTSNSTNPFDFGYSPPRPWAPENTNYVDGVSLPWRQT
jgi:hypothetical protein